MTFKSLFMDCCKELLEALENITECPNCVNQDSNCLCLFEGDETIKKWKNWIYEMDQAVREYES